MPSPRSSGSSRPSRPSTARSGGGSRQRTDANERRAPARPRGENPYKRKQSDDPPKSRGSAKRGDSRRATQDSTGERPRRAGGPKSDARTSRTNEERPRRASQPRSDSRYRDSDSRGDTRGRGSRGGYERDAREPEPVKRKGWGSLARKGASTIKEEGPGRRSSREEERQERPRVESESWEIRRDSSPKRGQKPRKTAAKTAEPVFVSPEAIREIEERVSAKRSDRFIKLLRDAARAYATERWSDARKALRPLLAEVGDAPVVQELDGMVLYRSGKYAAACKQLEAAHSQTLSYDLYPALMDSRRALKQHKRVEELWTELKEASPGPEVLTEGRIVYAAYLADRNRLEDAIRLLEGAPRPKRDPKPYHLRSWYLLGDLYERAGDIGKARTAFERVARYDEDLADVLERLDTLD